MIRHLPAILFIIGTLAVYAFYVMFAVPALSWLSTMCWNCCHRLLVRITGGEQ
jgi:hypothetical protein